MRPITRRELLRMAAWTSRISLRTESGTSRRSTNEDSARSNDCTWLLMVTASSTWL